MESPETESYIYNNLVLIEIVFQASRERKDYVIIDIRTSG